MMKGSRFLLAMVLFAGVASLATAHADGPALPELESRDLCTSNVAFDYSVWQFRKGYKALCCAYCKGSTEAICGNAYDKANKLYNACAAKTPESSNICTHPDAEIPSKPLAPRPPALPELETRDLCRSHIAFDYNTWSFRSGYKSLCCSYCASGSMETICLNVYDACYQRRNACAAEESKDICTKPDADIPAGPTCTAKPRVLKSLPELETRDLCLSETAFDYKLWQFRKGYKKNCCAWCKGSTEAVCGNVYDKFAKRRYNACGATTPECDTPAPKTAITKPTITAKPVGKIPAVSELKTRDQCRSALAFDATTWQFRSGFKEFCCQSLCRDQGSMESVCLNVYDACGKRYNACGTPETTSPCTVNPSTPVPPQPPVCTPKHMRSLRSNVVKPTKPAGKIPAVSELVTRDTCRSNLAFDYMTWQFRKGYKSLCCQSLCRDQGSMEKICLNAYDDKQTLYNACDAEETEAPCVHPDAAIPDHPVTPEQRHTYTSSNSLPELLTRDICVSNLAFDYSTWQYRTGYKSLCCSYCRAGSMEAPCINAYDACGDRYFACSSAETVAPCTNPTAPIPHGYPFVCKA